jgi:hypothetical protein
MRSWTLQDACRQQRRLWAFCLACGHGQRLDPFAVARLIGRNAASEHVARRLRCSRCGARKGHCVMDPRPVDRREER